MGTPKREGKEVGTLPPSPRSPYCLALAGHSTSTSSWTKVRQRASPSQRLKQEVVLHPPSRGKTQAQKDNVWPHHGWPPLPVHATCAGPVLLEVPHSLQPTYSLLLRYSGGPPGWEGGPWQHCGPGEGQSSAIQVGNSLSNLLLVPNRS